MTGVNPRVGFETGMGRAFGPGDQPKVKQANIYVSYRVDTETQRMQRALYNSGAKLLSLAPAGGDFRLLEGEPAFKIRGKSDEVLTALNGLEFEFMEAYANDPEMARQCVRSVVQFMGIVEQSARTDMQEPRVTLCVAGSVNMMPPGEYNFGGAENSHIVSGNRVVMDVPSLRAPIVGGSGLSQNKLLLVPRAADASPISSRLTREIAHIVNDPSKYKSVMQRFEKVCNSKLNAAVAILNWHKISALMAINLLVNAKVLRFNTEEFPELGRAESPTEEKVAKLGEGISLMHLGDQYGAMPQGQMVNSLTAAKVRQWANISARLNGALFPLPSPDTGKLNAVNEFGFTMKDNGQYESLGRSRENGEIESTPVGTLLAKSLTAADYAIQSLAVMIDDEIRNEAGWAASTPNQHGTAWTQVVLQLQGGMRQHST